MELCLGIAPMNLLDANAVPIDIFTNTPSFAPFEARLPNIALTVAVGQYALAWHLAARRGQPLGETVRGTCTLPDAPVLALPHPSPRNNGWLKRHPWFESELLPLVRARVATVLAV